MELLQRGSGWRLALAFAAVTGLFVAAGVTVGWSARAIDDAASQIATEDAPGIEDMAAARAEMRTLALMLHGHVDAATRGEAPPQDEIDHIRATLRRSITAHEGLPARRGGDREYLDDVRRDMALLDTLVDRLLGRVSAGDSAAARASLPQVLRVIDRAAADSLRVIDLDARGARDQAARIAATRLRAERIGWTLGALAVALAALTAGWAVRMVVRSEALLEAHRRAAAARADEFEQFAGRVAHDILSPLAAVSLALAAVGRRTAADARLQALVARGGAGLERTRRIVDGLLGFARAGARPEPGARADVPEVLADVASAAAAMAAPLGVAVTLDPVAPCAVATTPGVLTSLVSNLVQNAVKYAAGAEGRRVVVRAAVRAGMVQVQVEDNGPGVPLALQHRIFEPYVRAPGVTQPGMGLGLATVKRVAEAHGGRAGLRSEPGQGALFWFDLPAVATEAALGGEADGIGAQG